MTRLPKLHVLPMSWNMVMNAMPVTTPGMMIGDISRALIRGAALNRPRISP